MLAQNNLASQSYYMKAWVYYNERKDKQSLDYVNRALRYNPRNAQALALAGDILYRNRNYAQAVGPYEQVVRMRQSGEDLLLSLADCYCRTQRYQMMKPITDLLHREGKNQARLNKIEIRALLQQKQLAEAAKRLEALDPAKDDSETVTLRALLDWLSGRQAAAAEKVEKALELDSANGDALQLKQVLRQRGSVKK